MSLLKWSPVLLLVGGTLLLLPSIPPGPSPTPIGDVLGAAYAADRITAMALRVPQARLLDPSHFLV